MSQYVPDEMKNIQLLWDLMRNFDAHGPGALHNFMTTPADWHCRSCLRSKAEIARLDANGNLLCAIVNHHDHMVEFLPRDISEVARSVSHAANSTSRYHVVRFLDELICQDCNVAEGAAKNYVGAPEYFSFATHEIGMFIDVQANRAHKIRFDDVEAVYNELRPILRRMYVTVKSTQNRFANVGDWEVLKNPLERLLAKGLKKAE